MFQPLQLGAGVGRGRVTKKFSFWGACDNPPRIRVREFSRNGTRREEGAVQLSLKNKIDSGVPE